MKYFILTVFLIDSMNLRAIDESVNFQNFESDDHQNNFKSRPIDFKTHFDQSVQKQQKLERIQKESVKKSKLMVVEQPKTVRHNMQNIVAYHDYDTFQSRPIHWVDLEKNNFDEKLFEKKERNRIISPKKIDTLTKLQERHLLKKNAETEEQRQQKKIDEINTYLDQFVADFND